MEISFCQSSETKLNVIHGHQISFIKPLHVANKQPQNSQSVHYLIPRDPETCTIPFHSHPFPSIPIHYLCGNRDATIIQLHVCNSIFSTSILWEQCSIVEGVNKHWCSLIPYSGDGTMIHGRTPLQEAHSRYGFVGVSSCMVMYSSHHSPPPSPPLNLNFSFRLSALLHLLAVKAALKQMYNIMYLSDENF